MLHAKNALSETGLIVTTSMADTGIKKLNLNQELHQKLLQI